MARTPVITLIYNKTKTSNRWINDYDYEVAGDRPTIGQLLSTSVCTDAGITELSATQGGEALSHNADAYASHVEDEGDAIAFYDATPVSSDTLKIYSDDTKTTLLGTYEAAGGSSISITSIASAIGISIPQNANGFYFDGTIYGLNDSIAFDGIGDTFDGYFTYPKPTITGFYLDGTEYKFEGGGTEYNAGPGISIGEGQVTARKGPSPDGFHVPSVTEWQGVNTIMASLSLTTGNDWRINLHIPFAGYRSHDGTLYGNGELSICWSSSPVESNTMSYHLTLRASDQAYIKAMNYRAYCHSVRCFRDSYITPDSSWTVVQGTLGSAGIFRNQADGLISITSDGTTGYTIMDKNLGATTVYNYGDTLTQDNMGNMYQWGNNYGFPSTGTISKTSSTQVDASAYGPTNPYSSDTFIITKNADWSSVQNDDLWGDTTGTIPVVQEGMISNTGVLSINGQTGNVTIETGGKIFEISSTLDISNMQKAYDYYVNGGVPTIKYGSSFFNITAVSPTFFVLSRTLNNGNVSSGTAFSIENIRGTVSNGTITKITFYANTVKYSSTAPTSGYNYTITLVI